MVGISRTCNPFKAIPMPKTKPLASTQHNDCNTPAPTLPSKLYGINNPNYNRPNSTTPTDEKNIQNNTLGSSNMAKNDVEETINPLTETVSSVAGGTIDAAEEIGSTVSNGMQALSNGVDDFCNNIGKAVSHWWA